MASEAFLSHAGMSGFLADGFVHIVIKQLQLNHFLGEQLLDLGRGQGRD